jgi:radical SAM superfamily enzyme YgiQ (UPF0313 family)
MINSGVDVMQATFLTPLPGTRLFDGLQKQNRLLYPDFPADWDRYDMSEVTHKPLRMSPDDLYQAMYQGVRRMYAWPVLFKKAARTLRETRNPMAMMFSFQSNTNYRSLAMSLNRSRIGSR